MLVHRAPVLSLKSLVVVHCMQKCFQLKGPTSQQLPTQRSRQYAKNITHLLSMFFQFIFAVMWQQTQPAIMQIVKAPECTVMSAHSFTATKPQTTGER